MSPRLKLLLSVSFGSAYATRWFAPFVHEHGTEGPSCVAFTVVPVVVRSAVVLSWINCASARVSFAGPHDPERHWLAPGHTVPQRPQLFSSDCNDSRVTQVPPHSVDPNAHRVSHVPIEQALSAPHALPHRPQWAAFD